MDNKSNESKQAHYINAYNHLKNGIINGDYDSEYVFIEKDIAAQLGISRTPVREAIRMLKAEKLLVNVPKKGIVCRTLTKNDICPVYEVSEALEGMMAYIVAQNHNKIDLSELERSVIRMEAALRKHDEKEWVNADAAFHQTLMQLSKNKFAIDMMKELQLCVQIIRVNDTKKSFASMERSTVQHREAYDAIASGEAEYARTVVQHHWRSIRRRLMGS
jgi:DNA-binding GntR family transcriptional regulator